MKQYKPGRGYVIASLIKFASVLPYKQIVFLLGLPIHLNVQREKKQGTL